MTPSDRSNADPGWLRIEALLGACLEEGEARLEELVEKLCAHHPDRAAGIREEVETARSAGLRRPSPEEASRVPSGSESRFARIGPYQPLRELGRGGQGFVYLAEDTRLHRIVALKVLKGFGALSEKVIQRFRREAEITSRLDHPGICGVYDAGVAAGIPYIAMRLVEGKTLAESIRLARSSLTPETSGADILDLEDGSAVGPAEPPAPTTASASTTRTRSDVLTIAGIFEKAARALHAAHEAGVIHRDIKPGNIMVTPAGEPVILDFGLASEEADELSLTQTGDLFGTPAYMSPEQLLAQRIKLDRRTDVYSLAVTLYECVTLKRPFDAPTRDATYVAIQFTEAVPSRKLNREIPPDLETVLQKAIEKHRDRRYATALDFAEDLRRVRALEPVGARRVSAAGRLARLARRRPARAALAAILALGVPAVTALAGYALAKAPEIRRGEELRLFAEVDRRLEEGYVELSEVDRYIEEGQTDLVRSGRNAAMAAFEAALALKADCGEAIAGKAFLLYDTHQNEACLRLLDAHVDVDRGEWALNKLRIDCLFDLGRQAEVEDVDRRMSRDLLTPFSWFFAGQSEMERYRKPADREAFRKAFRYFTRAALAAPRARVLYHWSLAHAAQGLAQAEACRPVHEALLTLWPHSSMASQAAGRAISGVDASEAVAAFRKGIALRPDSVSCRRDLARALIGLGRSDEAIAFLEESIAVTPDDSLFGDLTQALLTRGDADLAVAVSRRAVAMDERSSRSWFHLGNALKAKGRLDDAIAAFRRAIERNPAAAQPHCNLGLALYDQGDAEEAMAEYRKALELNPDLVPALANLGRTLCDRDRPEEAPALLRKSVELDPTDSVVHRNLAITLGKLGELDAADAAFRKAIEIDPDDDGDYVALSAYLCVRRQDLDGAIAAAEKAIALRPEGAKGWFNLFIALDRKRDAGVNIAVLRRMIALRPDFAEAHSRLAEALLTTGEHVEAIAAANKTLELDPKNAPAYSVLGTMLFDVLGDSAGAIDVFRRWSEQLPGDVRPRFNLGLALSRSGETAAAMAAWRQAIEIDPRFPDPYMSLARALSEQGEIEAEIAVCRKLIEHRPDAVRGHQALALALQSQDKTDEALACWRKMIELNPTSGLARFYFGHMLASQGEDDEARAAWEKAVELEPDLAEAHCDLAGSYARDGRLVQALACYRQGHELGSARKRWPYPSAVWLANIERAVLASARRLANAGLEDDDAPARAESATMIEALLEGWRTEMERGRRREEIAAALRSLAAEEPWVALRHPGRRATLPPDECQRWLAILAAVDDLSRRAGGGR